MTKLLPSDITAIVGGIMVLVALCVFLPLAVGFSFGPAFGSLAFAALWAFAGIKMVEIAKDMEEQDRRSNGKST